MKTIRGMTKGLLVAALLLGALSASAQTEKITNGGFESTGGPPGSLPNWTTAKWGGDGSISSTRDTSADRISGNASAKISIGGGGDLETAQWWELVFTQEFQLTSNRFYNGSFKIKASEPVMVQALIQRTTDPYTGVAWNTFMVGTDVQTVRLSGISSDTTTGAIRFFFGKTKRGTNIWIDDVSVMESQASGTTATVTVDFNAPETAADLTGLLSGMGNWYGTDSTQPGQQFIDPLRLKHWRVHQSPNFEFIDRAIASGAMPIVIRSLNWWAGSTPGNTNTPWADGWAALDAEFDALATRYGTDIIYEIWNEPDLPESFPNYEGGTFEKYLEMFERMHNRIRAIEPDAYIIGPSLSEAFDWFRLHQFMQFCVDNNLTVQGMSVHMWDDDAALADMRDDLLRVRSEIMENPAYEDVGMSELFVTEYAYDEMRMRPGSNLAMVRFMEEGLVDGATTSCWTHLRDCTSNSSCFDGTLAGMLTCGGTAPRPLWWAKKWYADSVGGRVEANSSHGGIVPIASNHSGRGQVILASRGYNGAAQDMTSVTVNLNNLVAGGVVDSDGTHDVWVYRAPFEDLDVAHDALWEPELVANTTVTVSGGNASLTLNNEVNAYDALLIRFAEMEPIDFRPYGTWTGETNNDLNTAGNWTGNKVPASGAIATWSGEQAGSQTLTFNSAVGGADGWKMDILADQTDSLTLQNASASTQDLRLRTGDAHSHGNSLDIAAGAGAVTIGGGANAMQVVLGPSDATTSTAEIRNNSSNKLTFASNATLIRGGTGARNIWIRGTGDVDILGDITLTGTGNLSMWGSGTLRLEGSNTAASIFRAAGNGTVVFTRAAAINGFTEFRIGFTGQNGTLRYEGSENATLTKRVRIGEGNGTGAIEASGSGTLTFSHTDFIIPTPSSEHLNLTLGGTNTGANTISGKIINHSSSDSTRTLGIIKEGTGRWILSGSNSYGGATAVNEGTLIIDGNQGGATNTVTVADGAVIGGSGTIGGSLTLQNGARFAFASGSTLTVNGASANLGNLSIAKIDGLDSSSPGGTHQLLDGTATFDTSGVSNIGEGSKYHLGDGVYAYFETTGGLQLVVDAPIVVPTGTWSGAGTGDDLNTAANWGGDAVPGSGATATWAGFEAGNLNLTFGSAVGGAAGWKLNFTADQTGNISFSNTAAASRNLRINTATDALTMAAGAGGMQIGTLTGTANPIQVVLGQSGGTFQLHNNSSNELVFGSNTSIASGGAGTHDVAFYGTGVTRILGTYSSNTANAAGFIRVRNGRLVLEGDNQHTGSIMADSGVTEFTSTAAIGTGAAGSYIRIGQANLHGTLRYSGDGDAVVNREISLGNGGTTEHTGNATIESTGLGKVVFTNATFNLNATQHASVTRWLTLRGAGTADNEIQGVIANNASGAGAIAVAKTDAGKWILSGANTYTGLTSVNGGILEISNSKTTGELRVAGADATLLLTGDNTGSTSSLEAHRGMIEFTSLNALGGASNRIRLGQAADTATLRYSGSDDITVARGIRIGNGNLDIHPGGSIIEVTGAGRLVFSAATLQEDQASSVAARTLTLRGTNTKNNEIQGIIADHGGGGAISVLKDGPGTWVLSGINTYTGGTTISNGVLVATTEARNLGTNDAANPIRLEGGTLRFTGDSTQNIIVGNRGIEVGANGGTLDVVNSGARISINNVGLSGSGNLTITGAGNVPLTAADNTAYTGEITIDGGELRVQSVATSGAHALGSGSHVNFDNNGRLLFFNSDPITFPHHSVLGAGGGTIVLGNAANQNPLITWNGEISGPGSLSVTTSGGTTGELILGASNSFTGSLNLLGGTVVAAAEARLPADLVFDGGTLRVAAGGNRNFNARGTTTLNAGGGTIEVELGGNMLTFGGVISGSGGLTKTGADTLRLSQANTYTGATAVDAGTLILFGAGSSLHASSAVTVASGAAIGGDGSVGGNLALNSGAELVFSTSDTLTVGGTLSFGGFGIADLQGLDSSVDAGTYTVVSGTVNTANLSNIGEANAVHLGDGKYACFVDGDNLQVKVFEAQDYASWADDQITDPAKRGLLDDASGDGIANLVSYAFNMDPELPAVRDVQNYRGLPSSHAVVVGGTNYLETVFFRDPGKPDIILTPVATWDLTGTPVWTVVDDVEQVDTNVEGIEKWRARIPGDEEEKGFIRIRVESR